MFNPNYALLVFSVAVIAVGQILFKLAARSITVPAGWTWASLLAANLFALLVVAGVLALYFVSTLSWVWALRTIPLSIAFMFNSLAFVIVPLAGFWMFGEAVPRHFIVGLALVLAGLAVINLA